MTGPVLMWAEPLPRTFECLHAVVERSENGSYTTACGGRWDALSASTSEYVDLAHESACCKRCWAYAQQQPRATLRELERVMSRSRDRIEDFRGFLERFHPGEVVGFERWLDESHASQRAGGAQQEQTNG